MSRMHRDTVTHFPDGATWLSFNGAKYMEPRCDEVEFMSEQEIDEESPTCLACIALGPSIKKKVRQVEVVTSDA